jgi:hypothetical protein
LTTKQLDQEESLCIVLVEWIPGKSSWSRFP